jgi:hypothetical protein
VDGFAHRFGWHRPLGRADTAAMLLGIAAVGWLGFALWPGGAWPAWPCASLGGAAFVLARRPGRVALRAVASIAGALGIMLGSAQIALLWLAALLAP